MFFEPSMVTTGSATPVSSTRSEMICRACSICSRLGLPPVGVRADSVMLVPPCRSSPSFGWAFLSPVKNTSPYRTMRMSASATK